MSIIRSFLVVFVMRLSTARAIARDNANCGEVEGEIKGQKRLYGRGEGGQRTN